MSDRGVAELLKLAGRRPAPDDDQIARARAAAHTEWTRIATGRRRWRRSWWASAIAATIAIAVVASAWFGTGTVSSPAPDLRELGTLQTQVGAVTITGNRIDTAADGRVMFLLTGGTVVRIDRDSRVALESAAVILDRGAVYLDAGPQARDRDVVVRTPLGIVRHLGTQFEVRVDGGSIDVRVREGAIAMEAGGRPWIAHVGEAIRLTPDLTVDRRPIAIYGPEWSWVATLPRPFTLEGSTLGAFLNWICREQGWQWRYSEASMRERFDRVVLRGSVEGLTAEEALHAVLRSSDLSFTLTEGRLVVRLRTPRRSP